MIDVSVIFVLISYNLFEIDKERNRKIFFLSILTAKTRFQKTSNSHHSKTERERKPQNLEGRAVEIRKLSLT